MNILFICNEYPPGKSGGIGSITRTLSKELVQGGHNVLVAGLYKPGYGGKDYEQTEGVRIWRRRMSVDFGLIKNNYSRLDSAIIKVLKMLGIYQADVQNSFNRFIHFISELIEREKIDIIEWPDFNEYFSDLAPEFKLPRFRVPVVVKFHGTASYIAYQMKEQIDENTYGHEKKHIENATALVSVSRNTGENYSKFYNIAKEVSVLYNSIDLPALMYLNADKPSTIVYTGTLTKLKGIESLLKAWNLVFRDRPDSVLKIFGKGNHLPLLRFLDKDAVSSVHFEGFVTRDELYRQMAGAAAAIFPSFTECFAIAPLEAMAVGCPVIYTKRVSGPELIQSQVNGLLIDPDNIPEIADSILTLLNDKSLREKFSARGRQTIEEKFDIKISAIDHIKFYEKVLSHANK